MFVSRISVTPRTPFALSHRCLAQRHGMLSGISCPKDPTNQRSVGVPELMVEAAINDGVDGTVAIDTGARGDD